MTTLLPDEEIVREELARDFASAFDELDQVLTVAIELVSDTEQIVTKPRGLNRTVARVVFGRVRICVHAACCEKGDDLEAGVMRPRRSVEALNDTAHGERARPEPVEAMRMRQIAEADQRTENAEETALRGLLGHLDDPVRAVLLAVAAPYAGFIDVHLSIGQPMDGGGRPRASTGTSGASPRRLAPTPDRGGRGSRREA